MQTIILRILRRLLLRLLLILGVIAHGEAWAPSVQPVQLRSVFINSIFEFSIWESQIRTNWLWMFFRLDVGFRCARVSAQKNTNTFRKSTVMQRATNWKHHDGDRDVFSFFELSHLGVTIGRFGKGLECPPGLQGLRSFQDRKPPSRRGLLRLHRITRNIHVAVA